MHAHGVAASVGTKAVAFESDADGAIDNSMPMSDSVAMADSVPIGDTETPSTDYFAAFDSDPMFHDTARQINSSTTPTQPSHGTLICNMYDTWSGESLPIVSEKLPT